MSSLNRAMLIGHLGKDPEVRYTAGGEAVANFSIATTEKWTDKAGAKQEKTEWHNVVVWGKSAEACGEHLAKGRQVYVEGRLQTRKWQDKDGKDRYTTEIVASSVQFLGGKPDGSGEKRGSPDGLGAPVDRDDIPF